MSVALQDAQICAPGPHSFAILVSHYTRYLMHVRKIMNCPRCEKLRQRHRPEGRMLPLAGQIFLLQIQQPQRNQVLGPNAAKLV